MNALSAALSLPLALLVALVLVCVTVLAALGVVSGEVAGELFLLALAYLFGVATPATAIARTNNVGAARDSPTKLDAER